MTDSHASSDRIPAVLTSAFDAGFDAGHALQTLLRSDPGARQGADAALLRIMLLRRDYPDAQIVTELVSRADGTSGHAIVRATITLPTGATASSHAEASGDTSALEETERRAIGRALDILGHTIIVAEATGTQEVSTPPRSPRAVSDVPAMRESPISQARQVSPVTSDTGRVPDDEEDYFDDEQGSDPEPDLEADLEAMPPTQETSASPASSQTPESSTAQPPSVVDAMRRANLRRRPTSANPNPPDDAPLPNLPQFHDSRPGQGPAASAPSNPAEPEREPTLEDYSWTAFWRVARPQGFNKVKVEEQIGRSIDGMTPIQVREALAEKGVTL